MNLQSLKDMLGTKSFMYIYSLSFSFYYLLYILCTAGRIVFSLFMFLYILLVIITKKKKKKLFAFERTIFAYCLMRKTCACIWGSSAYTLGEGPVYHCFQRNAFISYSSNDMCNRCVHAHRFAHAPIRKYCVCKRNLLYRGFQVGCPNPSLNITNEL